MFNVVDYGAVQGGKVLCREAFQKAIDACAKAGGGTVFVPAGTYLLGTVFFKDNVHIVLEAGALILGSTDLDNDFAPDEPKTPPVYQDVSHTFFHHSLFVAEYCDHISITGPGRIDMQRAFEKEGTHRGKGICGNGFYRGAKVVAFKECHDVLLSDFSSYNATDLNIYLAGCETVRIYKLFVDTVIDGISPDCCKDVVISDCIIHSGDDAIVPKSSYTLGRKKVMENMVISNCVIQCDCSAIKFGTESNGGFKNIAISNCVIYNCREAALSFESMDGGIIDGITVTNITEKNVGCPFLFILGDRGRGPDGHVIGSIKNIRISHLIHTGPYTNWPKQRSCYFRDTDMMFLNHQAGFICGLPDHYIENVRLEDIHLEMLGGKGQEAADRVVPEAPECYPNPIAFGTLNAFGFFFRHCKNLKAIDIHAEVYEPDARPEIVTDDVINFVRQ